MKVKLVVFGILIGAVIGSVLYLIPTKKVGRTMKKLAVKAAIRPEYINK